MWSLALHTLIADRGKLVTALVGVVFSVVLVNVQGGFFLGFLTKAGLLADCGEADIWVGHLRMNNVDFPSDIPRRWVDRVRSVPGVRQAEPYLIGTTHMTLPSGGFEMVVVVGVDPESLLGSPWNLVEGTPDAIRRPDGVVIDRYDLEKLEYPKLGEVREVGGRRARIVAISSGIKSFLVTPYLFTTYDRAARYLRKDPQVCSYYLVRLEPGADARQVCASIRKRVPELDAFPRQVYSRISAGYWLTRSGLGISFGAATVIGLCVGLVMVAQTLYALVLDRLAEFGLLKALGAREGQIYRMLFVQAAAMALAGSLAGLVLVAVIQHLYSTPIALILVPWWLSLASSALVLAICLAASLLPYLRIRKVDPVMVLQS